MGYLFSKNETSDNISHVKPEMSQVCGSDEYITVLTEQQLIDSMHTPSIKYIGRSNGLTGDVILASVLMGNKSLTITDVVEYLRHMDDKTFECINPQKNWLSDIYCYIRKLDTEDENWLSTAIEYINQFDIVELERNNLYQNWLSDTISNITRV